MIAPILIGGIIMKITDLGTFTVDVQLQDNSLYDVYIAHEGSSGSHYTDVNADRIGQLLADDIEYYKKYEKQQESIEDHEL